MVRVADFLTANIRTIGLIYVIGAAVVCIATFLILTYAAKAEDEERELERYEDDEELKTWMLYTITFITGIICGVLWIFAPLIIFGVWVYFLITEKFSELAAKLKGDDDERETEE